jgi:hypothetical protein
MIKRAQFSSTVLLTFTLFCICALSNCKEDKNIKGPPFPIEEDIQVLTILPEEVIESSGLVYYNEQLWTHNDGVGDNRIYQVSQNTPDILDSIAITQSSNVDWEDIAQDATHLYIGDFGNNAGNRKDLTIYKFPKNNFDGSIDTISFSFADQTNFEGPSNGHDFDCEAMIISGDSIYLFSKNHFNQQCRLYHLPKTGGQYSAKLKSTFDTQGMITGADVDTSTNTLCLLGYQRKPDRFTPFVWIFSDFSGTNYFEGTAIRIDLAIEEQTEGIAAKTDGQFFISSENLNGSRGQLFLFDTQKWK